MKKKLMISIVLSISFVLLLSACGEKSQESVAKKLEENIESMSGYKAKAEMTMNIGLDEQKYGIEAWHNKEDFYRVKLTNGQEDQGSQVILKNEDGVFVLTPALNKKFKFQTEWPHNSSQPYLYESLVKDILQDEEAIFEATDSHYIFKTKTNYQSNQSLPYQEVYIDKKNYTPLFVKIQDVDKNVLVEVKFLSFELDPTFLENDFQVDENLDIESSETINSDDEMMNDSFMILFPLYTAGAELSEKKEISLDDGERVIMTFTGDKSFTLVQEKTDVLPTLTYPKEVKGDIIDLGFTLGALSDRAVEWSYNGVDYYLASEDLTVEELIKVAQSVQGKEAK